MERLSLTLLAGSNIIFIYVKTHIVNHVNTLSVIEVVIYFIPDCFYYLFHTSSLSLCVLFYREYELQSPNWKSRHQWKLPFSNLEISCMRGHFCFCHRTANIIISSNCYALNLQILHAQSISLLPPDCRAQTY